MTSSTWAVRNAAGGGRFEELAGYARVKRVGPFVYVSGTTAVEASGRVHAPGDVEAQTRFALRRIDAGLREVGSELADVVRVRAYLTEMALASGFARAHGEVFRDIQPVLTAVAAGLATPGLVVELEVDAIVGERTPLGPSTDGLEWAL